MRHTTLVLSSRQNEGSLEFSREQERVSRSNSVWGSSVIGGGPHRHGWQLKRASKEGLTRTKSQPKDPSGRNRRKGAASGPRIMMF